jgi:hypothetical protein
MSINKTWNGIMILDFLEVLDESGKVILRDENRPNVLNTQGEQFILSLMFNGAAPPSNYYFGLDNRATVTQSDTLASIVGEPTSSNITGYQRAAVASSGSQNTFSVPIIESGNMKSYSPILVYNSGSVGWGPVQNIFLTTSTTGAYDGFLISSAPLTVPVTLTANQTLRLRFAMQLSNC